MEVVSGKTFLQKQYPYPTTQDSNDYYTAQPVFQRVFEAKFKAKEVAQEIPQAVEGGVLVKGYLLLSPIMLSKGPTVPINYPGDGKKITNVFCRVSVCSEEYPVVSSVSFVDASFLGTNGATLTSEQGTELEASFIEINGTNKEFEPSLVFSRGKFTPLVTACALDAETSLCQPIPVLTLNNFKVATINKTTANPTVTQATENNSDTLTLDGQSVDLTANTYKIYVAGALKIQVLVPNADVTVCVKAELGMEFSA